MKETRHQKILEIIKNNDVYTQEGILEKLNEAGFLVTQATVSRDIKKLNLVKMMTEDGKYKYTIHETQPKNNIKSKFKALFAEAVINIDYAGHIVAIKCHVGMANAACAALDLMHWNDVVGTLAGDDTIFILLRSEQSAVSFIKEIEKTLESD